LARLTRLHASYKDQAAFLFVAITDAGHPDEEGVALVPRRLREDGTPEGRLRLVRAGLEAYKVPFPGLLDEEGQAERAYQAFPQRLVIVGADGLVAFDGGWGASGRASDWDIDEVESRLRLAILRAPLGLPPQPGF
jgi:hypothetical protein